MTSGTITRSLGLSALVVSTITSLLVSGAGVAHAGTATITSGGTLTQDPQQGAIVTYTGGTGTTGSESVAVGYLASYSRIAATSTLSGFGTFTSIGSSTNGYTGGNYLSNIGTATAISPVSDYENSVGYFDYTVDFTGSYSSIIGTVESDNEIAAVYLNGAKINLSGTNVGGTDNLASFAGYTGGAASSNPNKLDFIIYNNSGPTGIVFNATATPEPGVFVTAASMLSMTGIGLVRGRRRAKGVKVAA